MTFETEKSGDRYYRDTNGKRVPSVTTVLRCYKESDGLVHWAWQLGMEGKDYKAERGRMADVGKIAHSLVDGYIKTNEVQLPLLVDVPEDDQPTKLFLALKAFGAFREWLKGSRIEIIASEVGMVCDESHFGGTLDAVGLLRSTETIVKGDGFGGVETTEVEVASHLMIDWKSGNDVYPEVLAQVGAYAHLWEHGRFLREKDESRYTERLPIDGIHVIRLGKEYGDFHHHYVPDAGVRLGKQAFFRCLDLYNIRKELKKLVK